MADIIDFPTWKDEEPDDGKFGAGKGEYEYTCDCGSRDFYIFKATMTSVPEVRCRGCGALHTNWFD